MTNAEIRELLNRYFGDVAYKAQLGDRVAFAKGLFTTSGGDADEVISIPGVEVGDVVLVTVNTAGSTPRTVDAAIAAADSIEITMSGDPSTDHVLNFVVFKA